MIETYNKTKILIPDGQLIDVKFEYFENNIKNELDRIYKGLGLKGSDKSLKFTHDYLTEIESYKRRKHKINKNFMHLIDNELGDLIEL